MPAVISKTAGKCEMGLEFRNIRHSYGDIEALSDVSMSVSHGEILCLLGQSGCGKSTLLNLAAGILPLQEGGIYLDGEALAEPSHNPPPENRPVGLVFQDGALFPHLTVSQNIGFGVRDKRARPKIVDELLEQIGLEGFGDRFPHTLSGGQQQRVAVARALAPAPKVLLMDEPFASIDIMLRRRLREEIRQILKARNCISILVTHDPEEAIETADHIAVMEKGRISQHGTAEELYRRPNSLLVGLMAGEGAILSGRSVSGAINTGFGDFKIDRLSFQSAPNDEEEVDILLRPLAIALDRDTQIAEVVDVRRTGQTDIVTLRNDRGENLLLQVGAQQGGAVGDRVGLRITSKKVPAFRR